MIDQLSLTSSSGLVPKAIDRYVHIDKKLDTDGNKGRNHPISKKNVLNQNTASQINQYPLSQQPERSDLSLSYESRFIGEALTLLDGVNEVYCKDTHSASTKKRIITSTASETPSEAECYKLAIDIIVFNEEQENIYHLLAHQTEDSQS